MDETYFLVEAANWAKYYEQADELIGRILTTGLADRPPKEVIDNPEAFKQWTRNCEQVYRAGQSG